MQHQFGPPSYKRHCQLGEGSKVWFEAVFKILGWYYNHLELAGLPTLENRRNYLKLTTLYKIYHGYFYFPSGNLVPHLGRSNHPSPHSLYLPLARTNA